MKQRNLIALLAAVMLVAFGVVSAAEAADTIKSSKSNNSEKSIKTAADCTKAGGKWIKGSEGLGCYLSAKR